VSMGPNGQPSPDTPRILRVATYNVHKCRGLDGKVRPDRIAEVLRQADANVIALQEIFGDSSPEGAAQARYLADELGMYLVFGETRKVQGAPYGNAVLSQLPLIGSENCSLSAPGREERGCLTVDIKVDDRPVHLFNVHLGTSYFERRSQAQMLVTPTLIKAARIEGPRIVLGDFNEWTRGLVSRLLAGEFQSADIRLMLDRKRTYPGVFPLIHLDHIYYDEDLILESVKLHRSRLALVASDHLPLVAEFRLKPPVTPF
jgi:endonuclease/exonuclease/phosphatase family metal-dependent hydrolase